MTSFTTARPVTAPELTADSAAWTAYRRHVARTLADIVADANRLSPEELADHIREFELHGTPDDLEDTPAGNYVVHQALAAGLAPALYAIVMGDRLTLVNSRTRHVLGEVSITGTLYDLECLVAEDRDGAQNPVEYGGFDDLVIDPNDPELMILHPADRADLEAETDPFGGFTTDDDPDFFHAITAMTRDFATA